MDDATGEVANALFRPEEDTRGYLLLMEGIIRLFGIPLAIDGAPQCLPVRSVFQFNEKPRRQAPACSPTGALNPPRDTAP